MKFIVYFRSSVQVEAKDADDAMRIVDDQTFDLSDMAMPQSTDVVCLDDAPSEPEVGDL